MTNPIIVSYERDGLLTPQALDLLFEYYLLPTEKSPQDAFARAAIAFSGGDMGLAQRIYDAVSNLHFMYSSPILSNAPSGYWETRHVQAGSANPPFWVGDKANSLPISCFLAFVPDTRLGLIEHQRELAWLSVMGGGVGGHWDSIRAVSKKAPGPIPFLKVSDSGMLAWKQGKTRKGSYAAYLDVGHADVIEFLNIRVPTGGDPNRKTLNIHHALNITDAFMRAVYAGEDWELRCPHSGQVRDVVKARTLWERIIETRFRTGEPYLNFIDTANRAMPQAQKDKGLRLHGSNLCNEIHLATNEERTAVCCLSSLNLETFDEWPKTLVADVTRFLDNVLQFFIDNAPQELHRAKHSAEMERAIGIGTMGFHSYLQKHGVPFESEVASAINKTLFNFLKTEAVEESKRLAGERGEAPDMVGTGMRHSHLLAIAPNANSSIITGCSPSIEPWHSNYFVHRTRAGSHVIKNKYLQAVLAKYGKDDDETWASILAEDGSVQHLDFLTEEERDTFKTFKELDQHWVVRHAIDRQADVCQGQSVNLSFKAGTPRKVVNSVHLYAYNHGKGLKGLYYLRVTTGHSAEKVSKQVERVALGEAPKEEECVACHG